MFDLFALAHDMQSAVLPVDTVSGIGSTLQAQAQKMVVDFGADNWPPPKIVYATDGVSLGVRDFSAIANAGFDNFPEPPVQPKTIVDFGADNYPPPTTK